MNIADLLDLARQRTRSPSDSALAIRAGKSRNVFSQIRTGRMFPSDETVVTLCHLAQVDPLPWLVTLNIERTRGEARTIYSELAQHLAAREPKYSRTMVKGAAE